jgi:regulator of protease activity HflC (stomatin/prohibitin superfamily)
MRGFEPSAAAPGVRRDGLYRWGRRMDLVPLLVLIAIAVVVVILVRLMVRLTIVHEHERGLRFRSGRLTGLVGPGSYLTLRPLSELRVLDTRPRSLPIEGQEILTADGVAAKVSLVARFEVGDPTAAVTRDTDFQRTTYLVLQLGLRDAITRRTLDEALAARLQMGAEIRDACGGRLAAIGVELLEVDVRDVMLPGELKRAFVGVIAARKEGEAALERVRGETAALRGLANAGRMLDDSPGLLQLRKLQEIGRSSGNSSVFGAPDAAPGRPNRARTPRARDAAEPGPAER